MKKIFLFSTLAAFTLLASSCRENAAEIIVTPIRVGNLEVAQNDFPKLMNWEDAKKACANLGDGWRLPTQDELNLMYQNKDKIGGLAGNFYWSSTEYSDGTAWKQDFDDGLQNSYSGKDSRCNVRAVRAF